MSTIRPDALGDNGTLSFIRLNCAQALAADGGPCDCEPDERCWLVVLPCGCDCLDAIALLELTPALNSVWPPELRTVGSVIATVAGGCMRLIGATSTRDPEAPVIGPSAIVAVYPDCDAAPCPPVDCGCDGLVLNFGTNSTGPFAFWDCVQPVRIAGVERVEFVREAVVSHVRTDIDEGDRNFVANLSSTIRAAFDQSGQLVELAMTESSRGELREGEDITLWDYAQSYTIDDYPARVSFSLNLFVRPLVPSMVLLGDDAQSAGIPIPEGFGTGIGQSGGGSLVCNGVFHDESTNTHGCVSEVDTSTSVALDAGSGSVAVESVEVTRDVRGGSSTCLEVSRREIRVNNRTTWRVTLVGGRVIELDGCELTLPALAVACDPQADPAALTYDEYRAPSWAVSLVDSAGGGRYILSGQPSDGEVGAYTFSAEGCPPDEPDTWPLARACGGTAVVSFDPAERPPGGVTFVVGGVPHQPTGESGTLAPSSGTWSGDPCPSSGCAGLNYNDPRCSQPEYRHCPKCAGFDVGDPDVIPSDPAATVDPALAAEQERQMRLRMGQYAGRCPSCGD